MYYPGEEVGQIYWSGIVRIDDSFDNYVSNVEEFGDSKRLTISDVECHHRGIGFVWSEIKDISGGGTNNPITIWIDGKEIQQYMKCTALGTVRKIEKTRGLVFKEKYYKNYFSAKGFKLEPVISTEENAACLGSYRGSIGRDNYIQVNQTGLAYFFTGSRSAEGDDAARKSLTCVFIASNEKPFMATIRKKGAAFSVIFDSNGLREKSEDMGAAKETNPKSKNDPLQVLKLRLVKGEITKAEFEDLKKMIE